MIEAEQLHARILARLDMTRDMEDEELTELIYEVLQEVSQEEYLPLDQKTMLGKELFNAFRKLDLLQEFLEEESKKKEQEFQKQFREMIQTLSSALNTGYSVENAFYETQKELKIQYPEEARISRELLLITRKLRMHIPVEQVLEEFAERVPSEDVKSFVTVFVTAKKSGGDMIGIIRNTTSQIGDKIEVKREIDTLLAAKKYEFQIMSMVPYGIIAYMSLSFSDFMEELYGNVTGIGVMTLCLGIYVGAYYLGVRLLRIDV